MDGGMDDATAGIGNKERESGVAGEEAQSKIHLPQHADESESKESTFTLQTTAQLNEKGSKQQ